jgi:muconolactone delta-isomerase
MRFLVTYRPKYPAPPDGLSDLLKEMEEWIRKHGSRVEGIQFFVDGGGFGTIETDDPTELQRLITEHPFTQYSDVDVQPLIDPASAMAVLVEAYS